MTVSDVWVQQASAVIEALAGFMGDCPIDDGAYARELCQLVNELRSEAPIDGELWAAAVQANRLEIGRRLMCRERS